MTTRNYLKTALYVLPRRAPNAFATGRNPEHGAARMIGNPYGLARALAKLGQYSKRIPMQASPATSQMFIVMPLSGRELANLFSTHPPIEERIRRLTGR